MMLSISAVLGAIIDLWMRTGKSESMLTLGAANLFAAGLLLLVAGTALVTRQPDGQNQRARRKAGQGAL